jgi:prepilin-type N-terminal cleavage/methylation domain-containing protein
MKRDSKILIPFLSRPYGSGKGFSLVEMVVVISIITLLMGIVIAGASRIRQKTRVDATKSLISKITLALNEYHLVFHDYPPCTGEYDGSQNLYQLLGKGLQIKQGYDPATGNMKTQDLAPFVVGGFRKNEYAGVEEKTRYIIDAWGERITYKKPGKNHSSSGGKDNTSFVDIESAGPNKQFDDDDSPKDDDINNWQIEKYLTQ